MANTKKPTEKSPQKPTKKTAAKVPAAEPEKILPQTTAAEGEANTPALPEPLAALTPSGAAELSKDPASLEPPTKMEIPASTETPAAPEPSASPETEKATFFICPKTTMGVVNAPRGLNLRAGPHMSFAVLAVLPGRMEVDVLHPPCFPEVPGWALVRAGELTGWVDRRFLAVSGDD